LKSESGVGRQAVGEGISRQAAKVIIFQKFRPDPGFLEWGGLTPLWIFPSTRSISIQSSVKPEHSKTPTFPQNVLGNCKTWARELTEKLLLPFLRAFASSRETLSQGLLSDFHTMSAGFYPDTSAAAFKPKSTFAFTLWWVNPCKFPNAFHRPILSASMDSQAIFQLRLIR
jgi:hypothetical protein